MDYEEIKQEYLDTIESDELAYRTGHYFEEILPNSEAAVGCTLLEANEKQLYQIISKCGTYMLNSIRMYVNALKPFLLYVYENYPEEIKNLKLHQILNIQPRLSDVADIMKSNLFTDFNELSPYFSKFQIQDGKPQYACFVLIWLGLTSEEILALTNDDVFEIKGNVYVRTENRTICVTNKRMASILMRYKEASRHDAVVKFNRGWYCDDAGRYIKRLVRVGSHNIGVPLDKATFQRNMAEVRNKNADSKNPILARPITITNVEASGRFERMLLEEQLHGSVSDEWIKNEFGCNVTRAINDVRKMFECYKAAFPS